MELRAATIETLQVNVGKLCNQACKHCHVDASPARTGIMTRKTVDQVFVATPLQECERPYKKGMYAKARRGEIENFTGIDDPYEPPQHPEITLQTINQTAEENAGLILQYLRDNGFIRRSERDEITS